MLATYRYVQVTPHVPLQHFTAVYREVLTNFTLRTYGVEKYYLIQLLQLSRAEQLLPVAAAETNAKAIAVVLRSCGHGYPANFLHNLFLARLAVTLSVAARPCGRPPGRCATKSFFCAMRLSPQALATS